MDEKWKALLSTPSFYAALALALMAAGMAGYLLLYRDSPAPSTPAAAAPALMEIRGDPEEPPEPESLSPKTTEVSAVTEIPQPETPTPLPKAEMPEIPVSAEPVIPEMPRLIVRPLQGDVLTSFSVNELVYNEALDDWRIHDGVDIAAAAGTSVLASCSGTVRAVEDDILLGTTVVIDHDGGYQTTYSDLQSKPVVEVGDHVTAGQIIGAVGATAAGETSAPHLHFAVTKDGDVVDPETFWEG